MLLLLLLQFNSLLNTDGIWEHKNVLLFVLCQTSVSSHQKSLLFFVSA